MHGLFGEFVKPGNLVFDVGANRGEYAEMFANLGARVVAVEPNSALTPLIVERVPGATVVQAAVGATVGVADLFVGEGDGDSTLSDKYANVLRETHDLTPIKVDVTTMDELAATHGEPDFVKIDVEGYEPDVLAGMSFKPPSLSFEFHGALLDELASCLDKLSGYEFRVSVGNSYVWATDGWSDAPAIAALARELAANDPLLFADVYARTKR
jgi:FkbM family methyltransferase